MMRKVRPEPGKDPGLFAECGSMQLARIAARGNSGFVFYFGFSSMRIPGRPEEDAAHTLRFLSIL